MPTVSFLGPLTLSKTFGLPCWKTSSGWATSCARNTNSWWRITTLQLISSVHMIYVTTKCKLQITLKCIVRISVTNERVLRNAGLFIWIDLRHLLMSEVLPSNYSALRVTSSHASVYKARESRISDICIKNGVMIAPGNVYMPEEFGWFRVTFTVGKQALKEGLDRLWKSLTEAKAEFQS